VHSEKIYTPLVDHYTTLELVIQNVTLFLLYAAVLRKTMVTNPVHRPSSVTLLRATTSTSKDLLFWQTWQHSLRHCWQSSYAIMCWTLNIISVLRCFTCLFRCGW